MHELVALHDQPRTCAVRFWTWRILREEGGVGKVGTRHGGARSSIPDLHPGSWIGPPGEGKPDVV